MFNLKNFKLVSKLKNMKPQFGWLKFSSASQNSKGELFNTIISDKKFVQEDLKIRAMVEDVLRKEFGSKLDNHPDYEFLVDSVVNKLKQKQLGNTDDIEII